jgi:hypothetical protein
MQRTTPSGNHLADNVHQPRAADNVQLTTSSEQRAANNVQQTTCSGHDEWDDMQPTKCSGRWAAHSVQQKYSCYRRQAADDNAHDNAQQQSMHDYVLSVEAQPMAAECTRKAVHHADRTSSALVAAAGACACAIPYHSVSSCTRACARTTRGSKHTPMSSNSGGAADGGGTHGLKAVHHGDRTSSALVAAAGACP